MIESKLSYMVDPLREMLGQFGDLIRGYRERTGMGALGSLCDVIPVEITAALGMITLRVPSRGADGCPAAGLAELGGLDGIYDRLVVPAGCARRESVPDRGVPVHEFAHPAGWGREARRLLGERLDELLRAAGCGGLSDIDGARLRAVTKEYNALRRQVRGIALQRREKPDLLSCRDLSLILEAASALPPSATAEHLAAILGALDRGEGRKRKGTLPVLVYAGCPGESAVLDEMEEEGCLVVEDDTCAGRRQYDMSYDHESMDLLDEILDACTFRPLCPSVRPVQERAELFYSMMKSQGIEMAVFIQDLCCPARRREIEALRVRLMRSGVDPLLVTIADAAEKVRVFVNRG